MPPLFDSIKSEYVIGRNSVKNIGLDDTDSVINVCTGTQCNRSFDDRPMNLKLAYWIVFSVIIMNWEINSQWVVKCYILMCI